jgi:tRNA pseudouridine13 synthase
VTEGPAASSADPARVRLRTAGLPGLSGRIRARLEDFVVEEMPLYEPAGEGEHVHFLLEKHGISTFEALLWLSKAVQVSEHRIGYAGLKDAKAVTRQWMSVHRVAPARLLSIDHPRIRVLAAARHPSRLRIGHLRGNRFTIRIRGARVAHVGAAREALGRLVASGVPNAYGVQRFGVKQDGHLVGRAIVHGDFEEFLRHLCGRPDPREGDPRVRAAREAYDTGDVRAALDRFPMKHRIQKKALSVLLRTGDPKAVYEALGKRPRRIYVSAYQSWLFNRVLDRRLAEGTLDRLLAGDLAWQHASGALYDVTDPEAEAERARRFEASPTGPLPGYEGRRPSGGARALEDEVLAGERLDDERFRAPAVRTRGARRPLRVPLGEGSVTPEGPEDVVVRFVLPPGAFATVVLRELMKNGAPEASEDAGEAEDGEDGDPADGAEG